MIRKRYYPIILLCNAVVFLHGAASDSPPFAGDDIARISRGMLIPNLFDVDMITVPRTDLIYRPVFHGTVKTRSARTFLRGIMFQEELDLAPRRLQGIVGFVQGSDRQGVEALIDQYVAEGGQKPEEAKAAVIRRDPSFAAKVLDCKFSGQTICACVTRIAYFVSYHAASGSNIYDDLADKHPILAPSAYKSLLSAVIVANKNVSRATLVEAFKRAAIGLCEKREEEGLSTERMQVPILVLRENFRTFNAEMFGHE